MDKCKHCGKDLTHVEGRKKKEFCDVNCRNKFFYAKRKKMIEIAQEVVNSATASKSNSKKSEKTPTGPAEGTNAYFLKHGAFYEKDIPKK